MPHNTRNEFPGSAPMLPFISQLLGQEQKQPLHSRKDQAEERPGMEWSHFWCLGLHCSAVLMNTESGKDALTWDRLCSFLVLNCDTHE